MKIQSSSINMNATSNVVTIDDTEESVKAWVGDKRPDFEGKGSNAIQNTVGNAATLVISDLGKAMLDVLQKNNNIGVKSQNELNGISDLDRQKILLLQKMLEAINGKKIHFVLPEEIKINSGNIENFKRIDLGQAQPVQQTSVKQGWGLEWEYHQVHMESEKMSFSASGTIKTEDGREINFASSLSMSREFASSIDISLKAGDPVMKDPLIVNFAGNAPSLTNSKFSFDIDNDGNNEQISFLKQGSGFLALDLNQDGVINNGSELFGTKSGDGFKDLAGFDADKNGWIDENDPIYDKLRIWTKDDAGNQKLLALGEKGIGAIYLGNVSTEFSLKNSDNDLQGQIKQTGIYLNENGSVGTIQHMDVSV